MLTIAHTPYCRNPIVRAASGALGLLALARSSARVMRAALRPRARHNSSSGQLPPPGPFASADGPLSPMLAGRVTSSFPRSRSQSPRSPSSSRRGTAPSRRAPAEHAITRPPGRSPQVRPSGKRARLALARSSARVMRAALRPRARHCSSSGQLSPPGPFAFADGPLSPMLAGRVTSSFPRSRSQSPRSPS